MRRDTALVRHPNYDVDLVHGYTFYRLTRMAILAVSMQIWEHHDLAERVEVARSAITEHLYASNEAPDVTEVLKVARGAITDHVRTVYGDCGHRDTEDTDDGPAPESDNYWRSVDLQVQHDESDSVVEKVALSQIWQELSTAHREIFLAMALYGDGEEAARSLGKSPASFATQLHQARREFMLRWRGYERPPRPDFRRKKQHR